MPKLRGDKPSIATIKGLSKRAIDQARRSHKLLPHELLLCWANGIEIAGLRPDPAQQIYAAVAAAPYYQPRLANIEVKQDVRVKAVISAAPLTQHQWAQKYLNNPNPPLSYEVSPTPLVTQNNNSGEVIADQPTTTSIESDPSELITPDNSIDTTSKPNG